jgi:hypothetical protein
VFELPDSFRAQKIHTGEVTLNVVERIAAEMDRFVRTQPGG